MRRRALITLSLLVSLTLPMGTAQADPQDREFALLYDGKFTESLAIWKPLVDQGTKEKWAYGVCGLAYKGLKQYDDAVRMFDLGIAHISGAYANHFRGLFRCWKAQCLLQGGHPLEAESEFALSFKEYPNHVKDGEMGLQYAYHGSALTYWTAIQHEVISAQSRLKNGGFKQLAAEQVNNEAAKQKLVDKVEEMKTNVANGKLNEAFVAMMDYLGDKEHLSAVGSKNLQLVALGTPAPDSVFNLVAAAIQTNISGDTTRAQSLARAAAGLIASQPDSPQNSFCKQKLSALMPEVLVASQPIAAKQPSTTETESAKLNPNRPIADKWALVIGIGNFADPTIPKLKYSTKDARDFGDYLIKEANFAPDHVRVLLDEKATQRRVLTELGDRFLPRVAHKDDLVVIYVSSHGSPSRVDVKEKNYLVAYDTEKSNLFASGIEMQDLTQLIKSRVDSDRVLIVLDACHSGAADAGAKDVEAAANFDAEKIAQGSGQLVICSSDPGERSWESKRYSNGVFTRKLIDGLRKTGAKTRLGEAFQFVKNSVYEEVKEDDGTTQTPILKSQWDGNELLLAVPPSAPREIPATVKQLLSPDSTTVEQPPKLLPTGLPKTQK